MNAGSQMGPIDWPGMKIEILVITILYKSYRTQTEWLRSGGSNLHSRERRLEFIVPTTDGEIHMSDMRQ